MKFKLIILLILISIVRNSPAQVEQPYQPIIEPTNEELAKIGITLKGKYVVVDNDIPGKFEFGYILESGHINIPKQLMDSSEFKKLVGIIPLTHFDFYPYYITINRQKHKTI
jgi:hypothetical protein